MLIDNRNFLRLNQRSLLGELSNWETEVNEHEIIIESSKNGSPTMKMLIDNKVQYIHSKYSPESEAEKLIKQLDNIENCNHVLFIGTGMGYHIKELLTKYPDMKYTIYESNKNILLNFLSYQNINEFKKASLQKIITTTVENELQMEIEQLCNSFGTKLFVYTLPSIYNIYKKERIIIENTVKKLLKNQINNLATNLSFQKRWTINSLQNLSTILQTSNVLNDIDKEAFKGKPAIIVSAGPSLSDEFENLKYIKENGLAYIFSVGSSINALINQNIHPDVNCTYDPTYENQLVFKKMVDNNIKDIPLIFGSSVGYETLENYPGKMLHIFTNQDSVSPYFLDNFNEMDAVHDASSIAIITLQMLKKLGCNPIILVGQNLSYKNNQRYAEGIEYDFVSSKLTSHEEENLFEIKDVHGNIVYTDDDYNRMRQQLESFIKIYKEIEIINTTNNGADIEGTSYIPLNKLINEKLTVKNVVNKNWHQGENHYNLEFVQKQLLNINYHKISLEQTIEYAVKELRKIKSASNLNRSKNLENNFSRLDKELASLNNNAYYKAFIEPMVRVHNQRVNEEVQTIRFEKNLIKKGNEIVRIFSGYLSDCQLTINFITPMLKEIEESRLHCNREKGK